MCLRLCARFTKMSCGFTRTLGRHLTYLIVCYGRRNPSFPPIPSLSFSTQYSSKNGFKAEKPLVFLVPSSIMLLYFLVKRDRAELGQGLLAFSLALGLNGVITNIIKIFVGRPRPDFFYRCFPDGRPELDDVVDIGSVCTGENMAIQEGRKSFPSGHSSFSFCSLGFLSLWMCGKLGVFKSSRGEGWKLVVGIAPLMVALMVALSRTSDYHHHWQDVLVGSVIGLLISYVCYRVYYPRLTSPYCHLSYLMVPSLLTPKCVCGIESRAAGGGRVKEQHYIDPESPIEEQVKWI